MPSKEILEQAIETFRERGGILRTGEALRLGIHPRTLYALRDSGALEQLDRGLYRLDELPPLANPDLVTVSLKVPDGIICLVSALAFHELTTQVSHRVDVALKKGAEPPRLEQPPLRLFWFSGASWHQGVESHDLDGVQVRIYSAAKSVADAFKLRNRIGLDIAIEALKTYRHSPDWNAKELLHYARICRVQRVIRPYLEAIL
jgi:predicted transcriptional regulator of viral defense system